MVEHRETLCPLVDVDCPVFVELNECPGFCNGRVKRGLCASHLGVGGALLLKTLEENKDLKASQMKIQNKPRKVVPVSPTPRKRAQPTSPLRSRKRTSLFLRGSDDDDASSCQSDDSGDEQSSIHKVERSKESTGECEDEQEMLARVIREMDQQDARLRHNLRRTSSKVTQVVVNIKVEDEEGDEDEEEDDEYEASRRLQQRRCIVRR
eukprot:gene28534-35409_t